MDHRLGAAEIDDHIAVFHALDNTADDLPDLVFKLFILHFALGIAHLLHDHLLGSLCSDTPEIDRRQRVANLVAYFECAIAFSALRLR